ncbi:hypothetical protein COXBURSA334_2195 [Coxiella burnetii Q321]|nr:hypothetical protein COXBURSA334_2195 [Coxiella burnetii Q321]
MALQKWGVILLVAQSMVHFGKLQEAFFLIIIHEFSSL